jgi:dUTP pyrophosphatase
MDQVRVEICRLAGQEDLPLPAYQTEGAAAMDLHAAVHADLSIGPGRVEAVPCGISIAVPPGYEAQVRPRSGLAATRAVGVANSPGTIDSDYRGEVKVLLINHGPEPLVVTRGMRIAQMLVVPVPRVQWMPVAELPPTRRSGGGFGHTGR